MKLPGRSVAAEADLGPLWLAWKNSEIEKDLEKLTLHVPLEADRLEFDEIVRGELFRRLQRVRRRLAGNDCRSGL